MIKQRTLKTSVRSTGVGLHTGHKVTMVLRPAPIDTGIVFCRSDLPGNPAVPAHALNVSNTLMATVIEKNGARVSTVEHLMSAFYGMGIDNAYVDVGAASATEAQRLGVAVLAPVSLTKQPHVYGNRLLAAPAAGRRAACAALATAVRAKPSVQGTVVVAFTTQSLYAGNAGLETVSRLLGPFEETKIVSLQAKYPDTAVETVDLSAAEALVKELVTWMGGR